MSLAGITAVTEIWAKCKSAFSPVGHTHKTSDLTNDSGFITDAGVTSFNGSTGAVSYTAPVTSVNGSTGAVTVNVPSPGTGSSYPKMDSTRSLGSSAGYARVDHVHPTDTGRAPAAITSDTTVASGDKLVITDSSDGSKLKRSGIAIGTNDGTFLRHDGQWSNPPDPTGLYANDSSDPIVAQASIYVSADAENESAYIIANANVHDTSTGDPVGYADIYISANNTYLSNEDDIYLIARNGNAYLNDSPIVTAGPAIVPIGTILDFAGATAPTGYLACDGSAVSRTDYAELFEVIGTTWGGGDGSTTFNVPDLRGRTAIGAGTGTATDATAHALGTKGGTETHKLTSAQSGVPAHAHPLANSSIVYNANASGRMATSGSGTKISTNTDVNLNTYNNTAANASSAHPNMQPYATVTKIIRAE